MRKFLLMFLLLTTLCQANVEVMIPAEAVVDSEYIKLENIAQISGNGAARVGKVFLGPAPRKGTSIKILRSDIKQRLKGMGMAEMVGFAGSMGVSVRRAGSAGSVEPLHKAGLARAELAQKPKSGVGNSAGGRYDAYLSKMEEASITIKIKDALKRYIYMKLGNNVPLVLDIQVRKFDIDGVAGDKFTIEGIERGDLPGRCVFAALSSTEDGEISGYATVEAQIKLEVDAQVLGRNISRGQSIRSQDIVLKRVTYKPGMSIEKIDPAALDGRVALQSLRAGVPLSLAYFGSPLDVKRGQMITVCVLGNGFTIKEMALAQADGSVGDTIKVESVVSKKIYPVRVTGPNMADMPIATM